MYKTPPVRETERILTGKCCEKFNVQPDVSSEEGADGQRKREEKTHVSVVFHVNELSHQFYDINTIIISAPRGETPRN